MKRLIKDGVYTSIIGAVVLIFIMLMLWFGKANTTEMTGWLAFAGVMLRAKDTILGLKEKE
jgi:hypothetical protein